MKPIHFLVYLLVLCQYINAQQPMVDSLENLLLKGDELETYDQFFDEIVSDSLPMLKTHVYGYVDLAEKSKRDSSILNAQYQKFRLLKEEDLLDHALLFADSIQEYLLQISPPNYDIELKVAIEKARILDAKGQNAKAIEINYSLIEKIKDIKTNNSTFESDKYNYLNYAILGNNYLFKNDTLSYSYIKLAETHARNLRNNHYIQNCINLSYYANYFGNDGVLLNELADSSIYYAILTGNEKAEGEAYMHKCNALVELNRPDEGEGYCLKAEEIFSRQNDPVYISSVLNNIANVFEKADDPRRSLIYYERSFEIAKTLDNGAQFLTPLHNLANKYHKLGDYKEAAEYFEIYVDSQKVYYENLITSQFTEAEAKYQTGQKEVEISNQKLEITRQKAIRNKILLIGALFSLIGLAFFQWFRIRQIRVNKEAAFNLEKEKMQAEQLRKLDKMKTQFFTNVSHELRTPLTLIAGPLESILEKGDHKKIEGDLILAHKNTRKLKNLVDEILDLAKLESGKVKIKPIPVLLHGLINRLSSAFSSYAEAKHVVLKINNRVKEDLCVQLDVDKFETIINNLVSNAVKFTGENKEVIIDAAESNGELLLYVRDEGIGIPVGDEERIFERFYQSEERISSPEGGTGVGLALCKEIVQLMGGVITAQNNIGSGCTITVTMPLIITEEKPYKPKAEAVKLVSKDYKPILINGEKPRVLIVEDNEDMASYISSILEPYYNCDIAKDGYECLQRIQREHFDIINSDVMMPRMDGFTLKEKINNLDRQKSIPFIFLTARVLTEDKIKGLNLGVDDYITKPFNKEEYLTRIHNLLKNKKARMGAEEGVQMDSVDRTMLKKAETAVLENISKLDFKVNDLAEALNYSQRQLGRLIKKLTGLTPVNFILEIRLLKAYQLILEKKFQTISEVRFEVGIESASYFTKKFSERFGMVPSELS